MTSEAGEFEGMFYAEANEAIIKKLEETAPVKEDDADDTIKETNSTI